MKGYIALLTVTGFKEDVIRPALGSNYFPIDGRWGWNRIKNEAFDFLKSYEKNFSKYVGFGIYQGNINSNSLVDYYVKPKFDNIKLDIKEW